MALRRFACVFSPLSVALVGLVTLGCGAKAVTAVIPEAIPTPVAIRYDLVVLLPDDDTGLVGRAVVSTSFGTTKLESAGSSTQVAIGRAPSPVSPMTDVEVRRIFGGALAALPAPPLHFTLYFLFESEELTPQSRALLPEVLRAASGRDVPEIIVIGHTDTAGPAARNLELSLRRANEVRARLIDTRVDPSMIAVFSHGEAEPLIRTADDVSEPRNRRVEITVR